MKGKTYLFLCVLCFLLQKSKAQNYFNNKYDLFNNGDLSAAIDTFNTNYLTTGVATNTVYGFSWGLNLSTYNVANGNVILNKTYFKNGNNIAPQYSKPIHINNKLYLGGTRVFRGYNSWAYMWSFNKSLDSVSYKNYGFVNSENFCWASIYSKHDNKIYMAGFVDDTLITNSDILLIKTDTAGNEIWKKKIGIAGIDETAISIDTIQGQLLIAGYKRPHGTYNTEGFVMRLDTAGNIIWNRNFNTNFGGGCGAKTLKDGNILIYGVYKQYTIGTDEYLRTQLEKITANNVSIWQKKYNAPQNASGPLAAIENKHGNIVIASQITFNINKVNGKVNEINQNGDSLFTKEYAIMPGSQNYFRDVMQTSDGGYCIGGYVNPLYAFGGTGTQDIWLLKVDSNFCESAVPCGYGLGVDEKERLESGVKVYPNPANDVLHIELVDFNNEPHKIEVLNELGQVVFSQTTLNQQSLLNIRDLQNGMYYLYLKTVNKMIIKKVIIQK